MNTRIKKQNNNRLELIPVSSLTSMKCPMCSRSLNADEVEKVNQKYADEIAFKKQELDDEFKNKVDQLKSEYDQKDIDNQNKLSEEIEKLKKSYEVSTNAQLDILKDQYEKSLELKSKESKNDLEIYLDKIKKLENQVKLEKEKQDEIENDVKSDTEKKYKKIIRELEIQVKQNEQSQKELKVEIAIQEKSKYLEREQKSQNLITEQNLLITRLKDQLDTLQDKLEEKQPELQGEVGELNLYLHLTEKFTLDYFKRQTRGSSTGDIVQTIRHNGQLLDTQIVYDNKSGNTVTKKDIDKAKKYQKIHNTRYVLIVSSNLPKISVPNGYFATKEGIFLVHPSIVSEVANTIRDSIISVSKLSISNDMKNSKQEKIYEYLTSDQYLLNMENFLTMVEKLQRLQIKEEKDHQTMWNSRKELAQQILNIHIDLTSNVDSIMQKNLEDE